MTWTPRKNRYRAIRTIVDGIMFDSKGEAGRYAQLKLLEKAGQITDLKLQPAYPIDINGHRVCIIIPDFKYTDVPSGITIVEDFKSPATANDPIYKLKKKLLLASYGIHINEVFGSRPHSYTSQSPSKPTK